MYKVGDKNKITYRVDEKVTAAALGSGALPVFGTPFLVALMEGAALELIQKDLPEGKGTVGVVVEANHLAATPLGMEVTVEVEITAISENGKMIDFDMKAWDEIGEIGNGHHQRAIIDNQRFMEKTTKKLEK